MLTIIDMSLNEVPYRDLLRKEFLNDLSWDLSYDRDRLHSLSKEIAALNGLSPNSLFVSAGADGAIDNLFSYLKSKNQSILIPSPSYSGYKFFAEKHNIPFRRYSSFGEAPKFKDLGANEGVVLCWPNNPLGSISEIDEVLIGDESKILIIDESYIECCPSLSLMKRIYSRKNSFVVRSFSKAFGMPGMRLGYLIANHFDQSRMGSYFSPFPVSSIALESGLRMLRNRSQVQSYLGKLLAQTAILRSDLIDLGYSIEPSLTYFFSIVFDSRDEAYRFYSFCKARGVILANFCEHSLVRVSTGLPHENRRLVSLASEFIKNPHSTLRQSV